MYSQYSIGRGSRCDIRLDDVTVSKLHAELVVSKLGKLFIADCNSSGGTFKCGVSGQLEQITQSFIEPDQTLLLGQWQGTANLLLSHLEVRHSKEEHAMVNVETEAEEKLPAGRVRRDPVTGEIVSIEGHG